MILHCATGNPGKLREFAAARGEGMHIHPCTCYADLPECPETGETFEENAVLKAEYYSRHTVGLTFADDSGLVVDALNGLPGVHSARWSGSGDEANNEKLLAELKHVSAEQRTARYVCVIALAEDGKLIQTFRATAEGLITGAPQGSGGFGYDPYFLFPNLGKTFAELDPEAKWVHSHRGKAFRAMLDYLHDEEAK